MGFKEKLNELFKGQVVGAQVVVYKNKQIFKCNYGFASLENSIEVQDETIFRIASISKIIVAMAAMKLVETGLLDLDADLSNIFGFRVRNPNFLDIPITVKMLMLHTSSINDGYDDENPQYDNLEKGYNGVNGRSYFVNLADLLTNNDSLYYSKNTYSKYKPGTKFSYSNFGTGILACVIEKCSGELFSDYVREEILKPLKLDASFRVSDLNKKENISDTFYYDDKNNFKTARTAASFIQRAYPAFEVGHNFRGPAGGLFISMSDLAKLMQVLINDGISENIQILKKETVDYMLQMHYLGSDLDYLAKGLQLKFIDAFPNLLFKGHTGSAYGVSSFMYFSKEDNLGICFIANGGNYKPKLPGLNNIQAGVLEEFVFEFYEKSLNNTVKFNLNNDYAYLNGRKILFKNSLVIDGEVYLGLLDTSSILNIIPRIENEKILINNQEVELVAGRIALFKLLDKLDIKYAKIADNYEIYL